MNLYLVHIRTRALLAVIFTTLIIFLTPQTSLPLSGYV